MLKESYYRIKVRENHSSNTKYMFKWKWFIYKCSPCSLSLKWIPIFRYSPLLSTKITILSKTRINILSKTRITILSKTGISILSKTGITILSKTRINILSKTGINILSKTGINLLSKTGINILPTKIFLLSTQIILPQEKIHIWIT